MAILKCKICGGALEIDSAQSVTTCQYCGTKQTLPRITDERRANLYDRANHFRRNNDFDKAMGIYESILNDDLTDAEAYWSIVLCSYGIEYVEDTATKRRVPTVNRAQFTSIFDDENYKSAIANADEYQREIYEAEAAEINEIQKGILAISQNEEPFDVFICYKETDANGRRTQDSVLATELYHELTREGFKVFFSRITLEDKLGIAYEPYIFAALNSSKVMVVLGTRAENFNSVWVKNEWSRYLALIKNGEKKTLIPAYRDMDPYDLPEEFSHLQAQDMSRLGFMQDLVRGIKKIAVPYQKQNEATVEPAVATNNELNVESVFKRVYMALEDGEFARADAFCEQILNQNPEDAEAYVCKLLAELRLRRRAELANSTVPFYNSNNYKKAIQFGSGRLKNELYAASQRVCANIDNKNNGEILNQARAMLESARDIPACKRVQSIFLSIPNHPDSAEGIRLCDEKIAMLQEEWNQLRIEQQKSEAERKVRAKKARVRGIIFGILAFILLIGLIVAYVYIFHVAIPNKQYDDAIVCMEEKKYDEAFELLVKARENALTADKIAEIDLAVERVYKAESLNMVMTDVDNRLLQLLGGEKKILPNETYKKAIYDILKAGGKAIIVYECEGGKLVRIPASDSNEAIYNSAAEFTSILTATKDGYSLSGWCYESAEYSPSNATVKLVLKAVWTKKNYSIKYTLSGGTLTGRKVTYSVEDTFTLPIPKKAGHTFIGWTGTDLDKPTMTVTIPKGSSGSRYYTANWLAGEYMLIFDAAGGTCNVKEAKYAYGDSILLPTPTRDGYAFKGWYNGNELFSDGQWNSTENITLTAKWEMVNYYLNYNQGGVSIAHDNPIVYNVESDDIVLEDLSHEGGTFLGWYTESTFINKVTTIPKGSSGDKTLYAKWDWIEYTIEYDLNGGTVDSLKTTYTVPDLPLFLSSAAKKTGYTFYYWANGDVDGEPIEKISINAYGDYKLVANYIPEGLTVRFVTGGTAGWVDYCAEAVYSGSASHIEIPKYHNQGTRSKCPYILGISVTSASNLKSMTFSDEVIEFGDYWQGRNFEFNEYQNGLYIGSRNNPYHALVAKSNVSVPIDRIHDNTVYIGKEAFSDEKIYSIVIPAKVKGIHMLAFYQCVNLFEVYNLSTFDIKKGDSGNGYVAAYATAVHTSLDTPSNISLGTLGDYKYIYDKAVDECTIIEYLGDDKQIVLPENINGKSYKIGRNVFASTDIVSVVIPASVTEIYTGAFTGCSKLLEIYNLSSINIKVYDYYSNGGIGYNAKVIHTSIEEPSMFIEQDDCLFYYDEENDVYYLYAYIGDSTEIVLPDDINGNKYQLEYRAFMNNKSVVSVTISEGVTKIPSRAFEQAVNLTDVYFESTEGWTANGTDAYSSEELADSKLMASKFKTGTSIYKLA